MTTGRLRLATSTGLVAGWGLLVVLSSSGCSWQREYVRRGQVMDSLAVRVQRLERAQDLQAEEASRTRADVLTELESVSGRLDQLAASIQDMQDRVDRLGRKMGIGHGDITPAGDSTRRDTTAAPAADADQLYGTAYLDFTRGKYPAAVAGFRQFISLFPESDNADNAQYWIGESYYSTGALDTAETELALVLSRYPKGNKAPAAAYKLGLLYEKQGKRVKAREKFEQVTREYAGSDEARLARDRLRALEQ
jgi:tol-pal system protein YbgF